jgi:hypothetical protein
MITIIVIMILKPRRRRPMVCSSDGISDAARFDDATERALLGVSGMRQVPRPPGLARKRKTARRSFRLGGGEYERPAKRRAVTDGEGPPESFALASDAPRSVWAARRLLFVAAAQIEPALIKDLKNGPGPRSKRR